MNKEKTVFYVVHDVTLPDGKRLIHKRLSRILYSLFQMKKAFKRIQRTNPDAYCVKGTFLY